MIENTKEFEILGQKIRLNMNEQDGVNPIDVVQLVQEEVAAVREQSPKLSDTNIILLVALKLAEKNIGLRENFRNDIQHLETATADALHLIEEVSPTTF